MCCDGVWDVASSLKGAAVARGRADVKAAAERLVGWAHRQRLHGGYHNDDITAVVADIGTPVAKDVPACGCCVS